MCNERKKVPGQSQLVTYLPVPTFLTLGGIWTFSETSVGGSMVNERMRPLKSAAHSF